MKILSNNNFRVLILFVLVSGIVYFNSLNNGFHFDDFHHIVENKDIRDLHNIPIYFIDTDTFSKNDIDHYRPLLLSTYSINYAIGRLNPAGYHIVNLLFHAGTAFLVFLILQGIVKHHPFLTALASGMIFLVHPFNSEVVNYITARSSVMSGFFYLLAVYCWVRYREGGRRGEKLEVRGKKLEVRSKKVEDGREKIEDRSQKLEVRSKTLGEGFSNFLPLTSNFSSSPSSSSSSAPPLTSYFYLGSLLAFFLGMLSKEVVVTLPLVLILYDIFFISSGNGGFLSRLREILRNSVYIIPFFLVVIIPYFVARTFLVESSVNFHSNSILLQFLTGIKVLSKYIMLFFVPVKLSLDHVVIAATSILEAEVLVSVAIVFLFAAISFVFYRKNDHDFRLVFFFTCWFFAVSLPFIIVMLESPLQENRGYLSAVSLAVFSGLALSRFSFRGYQNHTLKISFLLIILILCSVITLNRNRIWSDELTLWQDVAEKYPDSWRAYYSLGKESQDHGLEKTAIRNYNEAIKIRPEYFDARFALGKIYLKNDDFLRAREMLEKAVQIKPYRIDAHMKLGELYRISGERDLAFREFIVVIELGKLLGQEEIMANKAREHIRLLRN